MLTKLTGLVSAMVLAAFLMSASMASSAVAQDTMDLYDVKAANEAFYRALSRQDVGVMLKLWSYKTPIRHISPRNREINVGLDAAMRTWKELFAAFPDFRITCEQEYYRISGSIAWVSVIEKAQWKNAAGETQTATHFGTNIFEKQDGRWFMVYHHGSAVPR